MTKIIKKTQASVLKVDQHYHRRDSTNLNSTLPTTIAIPVPVVHIYI